MGLIRTVLEKTIFGKKTFQSFFYKLHILSIKGMNYGGGADFDSSGELFVLNYLSTRLGNDLVIFDVGANIGEYAKSLKRIFQNRATVYCFEPSEVSLKKLQELLHSETGIITVPKGLSNSPGTLQLYSDSPTSGLASVYPRNLSHYQISVKPIQEIELTTIDNY
ncbi:MAG: FkbM family methyltransferase, partial [Bacteroidia bacterium]|nr:FkbM family methyltransferase [Bacteroidia bacterium]